MILETGYYFLQHLPDESFHGSFGLSESNRKAREQRRNKIFAQQIGKDIFGFNMNPSNSTASVPNKWKMQLDEN